MPNWGEILAELQATEEASGTIQFDQVRERYLTELHQVTGHPAMTPRCVLGSRPFEKAMTTFAA